MKHKLLDLFSGIGGFSLGAEANGIPTVAFVEKDPFCQKVLRKHWSNTPIISDIRTVKGEDYETDGVTIVSGGFPCQPFSQAGKRKGTDDDRYLWDETLRVVTETKPRWFIGENVDGLVNIQDGMVLRSVQDDLEKEGFKVQCLVVPASSIGAWHQRKRVWIIGENVSNTNDKGLQRHGVQSQMETKSRQEFAEGSSQRQYTWWQTESKLRGVPHGISYELDKDRANRIKALGNSIVPQIAYQLFKSIVTVTKEDNHEQVYWC
jgi:DNA (cytosine-5)-methyltransferase 1